MMEDKLKELYDIAKGNISCFIFLDNEEPEMVHNLESQKFIKHVKNSNKRPMYVITLKLVEAVVGPLEDKDIRKKQLKNFELSEEEEPELEKTNKPNI